MSKENKPKPTSVLDSLLQSLDFSAEGMVDAAVEQAKLYEKAANYRVQRMRERSAADMQLEQISAERELVLRSTAAAIGDKLTEGHIKAKLAIDEGVREAQRVYNEAEALDEHSKLLVRAFDQRKDMLEVVSRLTSTERAMEAYARESRTQLADTKESLERKYRGRTE